jgi:hypothetical protein
MRCCSGKAVSGNISFLNINDENSAPKNSDETKEPKFKFRNEDFSEMEDQRLLKRSVTEGWIKGKNGRSWKENVLISFTYFLFLIICFRSCELLLKMNY